MALLEELNADAKPVTYKEDGGHGWAVAMDRINDKKCAISGMYGQLDAELKEIQ